MSTPYVGEIRMFAGNFAPIGWELCQGQLLSIAVYTTLFQLIGTTYGGDGQSTFALPDLQGRMPVHTDPAGVTGNSSVIGQRGGSEAVPLTVQEIPVHTHLPNAAASPVTSSASNTIFSAWQDSPYADPSGPLGTVAMSGGALEPVGGNQPHQNLSPYLVVNFIIALDGAYPSAT